MEIKTEFNIDDEIYFIHNNLLKCGIVCEITVVQGKGVVNDQIMYTTIAGFLVQEQFAGSTPGDLMEKLVAKMMKSAE